MRRHDFQGLKSSLLVEVRNASVVAFDVFDTLIRRTVDPEQVKDAATRWLIAQLANNGQSYEFSYSRSLRCDLEIALYDNNESLGFDREFQYGDLTAAWVERLCGRSMRELERRVKDFEVEIEHQVQFLTPGIDSVLEALRNEGKRLFFLTDMYFDSTTIWLFLNRLGIGEYFEGGISSADYLLTKRTGRLYSKLVELCGVQPASIVMVGDNIESDIIQARNNGLKAVWINDLNEKKRRTMIGILDWAAQRNAFWEGRRLEGIIMSDRRLTASNAGDNYNLGRLFAPILTLFTEKVRIVAQERGAGIYFLAREGKLFYDLYKTITGSGEIYPEAHYLYVSRKSTFLASVDEFSLEGLSGVWRQYGEQSLEEIARNLSLPFDKLLMIGRRCGFIDGTERFNVQTDSRIPKLLKDQELSILFYKERDRQRDLLLTYLRQNGFFDYENVVLVDIGWKGTIQDNIAKACRALEDRPNLHGMYFAYTDTGEPQLNFSSKEGFFSDSRTPDKVADSVFQNGSIFEMVTTPDHGTTIGYCTNGFGAVAPVLEQYEEEKKNFKEHFFQANAAITDYAEQYSKIRMLTALNPDRAKHYFICKVRRYILYPTYGEASSFLKYSHVESFGVYKVTRYHFNGESLSNILRPPFLGIPSRVWKLINSQIWPSGVLRRARIPMVNTLYDLLLVVKHIM